ncbi:MAG: hypothetical protein DID92_2727744130 [Candidatus Nitrotoga sp. SPKER]|nr:MAG: hypothetical protein DID92_2727744130 [Candidatus Nitrotoga sp. SPKER]
MKHQLNKRSIREDQLNKYGIAAVMAAQYCQSNAAIAPSFAWRFALAKLFTNSRLVRQELYPRCSFLGLCESGLIIGIPKGKYCSSIMYKGIATRAIFLLRTNSSLVDDELKLWQSVTRGAHIAPHQEMQVVIALWKAGLIKHECQ